MAVFNSFEDSICSPEASLLLKDKGFRVDVYNFYHKSYGKGKPFISKGIEYMSDANCKADWNTLVPYPNDEKYVICSAPSHDVAIKWLLKNFAVCVSASVSSSGKFMHI